MLEVSHLSFGYSQQSVFYDVSFALKDSQWTALLGSNGSGKTTLLKCLLGLLQPTKGSVVINGQPLTDLSYKQRAQLISYVPQLLSNTFNYRVIDIVAMGAHQLPKELVYPTAYEALERINCLALADSAYLELSGGQQQLVHLAQALAQQTPILLLDEPTNHLDYGNHVRFLQLLRELTSDGLTILMTTHAPQDALNFCDQALVLDQQQLIAQGPVREVLTESMIETIYQLPVELLSENTNYPPQLMPQFLKGESYE